MDRMPDDLLQVLTGFHREVVLPDVNNAIRDAISPLRDDMLTHFDAIYKRFDRLETESTPLQERIEQLEATL